jgi:hypothetical protein
VQGPPSSYGPYGPPPQQRSSILKPLLIGCGATALLGVLAIVVLLIRCSSGPEGGVRAANQMESYAVAHLAKNSVLEPSEKLIAYYDTTIELDGSEAALVTTERVVYLKGGTVTSMRFEEITAVDHRDEGMIGDVIEVKGKSGERIHIEVAPFNGGKMFLEMLNDAKKAAALRPAAAPASTPEAPVSTPQ